MIITPLSGHFSPGSIIQPGSPSPSPTPLPLCIRQLRLKRGGYIQTLVPQVISSRGTGSRQHLCWGLWPWAVLPSKPTLTPPPARAKPTHNLVKLLQLSSCHKAKVHPISSSTTRALAPHPRTQEKLPSFWLKPRFLSQVGPGVVAAKAAAVMSKIQMT